jgi:uroporphyrinogen-III synthase
MGYRVHAVPTVETRPITFDADDLATYDWVVFTSVKGVDATRALPSAPRYAAVGEKTAAALRARGIEPAHIPPQANGEALADTLPNVDGRRVVLVRASAGGGVLPDRLRQRGAQVKEVTAYRTLEAPAASADQLRTALADPNLAAVVFASGSAVRGYIALGGAAGVPAVTIGPRTTASARAAGFHVVAESKTQSAEALASAVARAVPLGSEGHA